MFGSDCAFTRIAFLYSLEVGWSHVISFGQWNFMKWKFQTDLPLFLFLYHNERQMVVDGGYSFSLILEPGCYRSMPSADLWWTCTVSDMVISHWDLGFIYYCGITWSVVINAFPHSDVAITSCSVREIKRNLLSVSRTLANNASRSLKNACGLGLSFSCCFWSPVTDTEWRNLG